MLPPVTLKTATAEDVTATVDAVFDILTADVGMGKFDTDDLFDMTMDYLLDGTSYEGPIVSRYVYRAVHRKFSKSVS